MDLWRRGRGVPPEPTRGDGSRRQPRVGNRTLPTAGRWRASVALAGNHLFVVGVVVTIGYVSAFAVHQHQLGSDLSQAYLPAAHRVIAGQSPYPPATVAGLGA